MESQRDKLPALPPKPQCMHTVNLYDHNYREKVVGAYLQDTTDKYMDAQDARIAELEERETSRVRLNIDLNDKVAELEREIREATSLIRETVGEMTDSFLPNTWFQKRREFLERNTERKKGQ